MKPISQIVQETSTAAANLSETTAEARSSSLIARLHRSLGPLAGGLILDFADLTTFGPVGLFLGPIVGAVVVWWISSIYQYTSFWRVVWATLGGLYCAVPFTELFPLATIMSAIGRFREK